jgi:hypothetical protein
LYRGFVQPDGRLTLTAAQELQAVARRLNALEIKLAAIAAVADPTGGATVDAEARTAIIAIIAAAD